MLAMTNRDKITLIAIVSAAVVGAIVVIGVFGPGLFSHHLNDADKAFVADMRATAGPWPTDDTALAVQGRQVCGVLKDNAGKWDAVEITHRPGFLSSYTTAQQDDLLYAATNDICPEYSMGAKIAG